MPNEVLEHRATSSAQGSCKASLVWGAGLNSRGASTASVIGSQLRIDDSKQSSFGGSVLHPDLSNLSEPRMFRNRTSFSLKSCDMSCSSGSSVSKTDLGTRVV